VRRRTLLVLAVAGGLLLPGGTAAQTPKLLASVGPGFEIALTDAEGRRVTQVDPGTYEVVVSDKADFHNFHLSGPGVDERTNVEFVGDTTWTVTLVNGNYTFVCDPHNTQMRGTFQVGAQPAATPKAKLTAAVGPTFTISLKTPAGRKVATTKAGLYDITVRDRSNFHNFHLTGPGVNKKTTVPFVGTTVWRNVRLQAGKTYRFVCDPHKLRMKGSFRAVA
jgi:plastocyanin